MLARNETIFKWALYAAATALCFLVQGFLLQRITVWGVIPFVYPIVVAVVATGEGPFRGTVYALAVGVVCDLLLPEMIPCFYTILFPLLGLCAGLISQSWLSAGMLCSFVTGILGFLMTGVAHCLILWLRGKGAWSAGLFLTLRELLVSAVLTVPVTMLFAAVHRRTHLDD